MKHMQKILSVLVLLALCCGLFAACGGGTASQTESQSSSSQSESQPQPETVEKTAVRVGLIKGPTGIGAAYLMDAAGSGEARTQAASALYAYLAQEAPIAPICFLSGTVLTQYGRVEGLSPVYGNIFSQLDSWTIQE